VSPMHVESSVAAFLAGLGTGVHCGLMCGPLACSLKVRPLEYHAGRVVSYSLAGVLCGSVGQWVVEILKTGPLKFAPWVLLAVFVSMASGLERRLPVPRFVFRIAARIRIDRNLGWLTPLLPCGPLWLMLGAATATGSAITGGVLLLCFALGTIVLYGAIQAGLIRLQRSQSPWMARYLQAGLLWCATLLLAWRIWTGGTHGCCSL
jgi:sulfite exporter TauE/SafE